jgi:hypothetical protein
MSNDYDAALPGVHQAPNIQKAPEVYELENQAADPEGQIEAAMWRIAPWTGKGFLDLSAGTGFHLARWHRHAAGRSWRAPGSISRGCAECWASPPR